MSICVLQGQPLYQTSVKVLCMCHIMNNSTIQLKGIFFTKTAAHKLLYKMSTHLITDQICPT